MPTTKSEKAQQLTDDWPFATDYGEGRTSRWGLDEGDMSLIDDKLGMTPAERLRAATTSVQNLLRLRRACRL